MLLRCLSIAFGLMITLSSTAAPPPVISISRAWARATLPGQDVGAAYMALRSPVDTTLIEISSPATDSVEIHQMSMEHGIMKMRMLESLSLPAGKIVALEPGGFHLMLFDLKAPLKSGSRLGLSLTFKEKSGKTFTRNIQVPVRDIQD